MPYKGDLGVRDLMTLNRALYCEWNWRFVMERGALLRNVIAGNIGRKEGGAPERLETVMSRAYGKSLGRSGTMGVDGWKNEVFCG